LYRSEIPGSSGFKEVDFLTVDVLELRVAIDVLAPFLGLAVGLQTITQFVQKLDDDRATWPAPRSGLGFEFDHFVGISFSHCCSISLGCGFMRSMRRQTVKIKPFSEGILRAALRPWCAAEKEAQFDPAIALAVFSTSEIAINPAALAQTLRDCIAAHPLIEGRCSRTIVRAEQERNGIRVLSNGKGRVLPRQLRSRCKCTVRESP
jgi:hypothetical protein